MAQQQEREYVANDFERLIGIGRPVPTPVLSAPSRAIQPELNIGHGMEVISRAVSMIAAQRGHSELVERRAVEAEERLNAAVQRIAATELKLRAALEELQRERDRSSELLSRTQTMLDEASERLVAAETRSESMYGALSTLMSALEDRLGIELSADE